PSSSLITPRKLPRVCCANETVAHKVSIAATLSNCRKKSLETFIIRTDEFESVLKLVKQTVNFCCLRQADAELNSASQTSRRIWRGLTGRLRLSGSEHIQQRVGSGYQTNRRKPRRIGASGTGNDDGVADLNIGQRNCR